MILKLSPERRAKIKAAMQDVVDRMVNLWNAEGELEGVIGFDVDDIGEYLKDYAMADSTIDDEDVDAFLKWARNNAAKPEAF